MREKIGVSFYKANQCGYYSLDLKHQFGSFQGLIDELEIWSTGKLLGDTKLLEPSEDSDVLAVYMAGVEQKDGFALITAWNEVPAGKDGEMASMPANVPVGGARMVLNAVKKGTIPGFPTYFLAIPGKNVLATLRFDIATLGQQPFRGYCEQFLATAASHAVQLPAEDDEPDSVTVYGYRKNAVSKPLTDVFPRFRTSMVTKPGELEQLVKQASSIRRLHRREKLDLRTTPDRSMWQKLLTAFDLSKPENGTQYVGVNFDMSVRLNAGEVEALIVDWKKSGGSKQNDYGFKLAGDQAIHWLSSSRAKGEVHVGVERDADTGQINTKKLLPSLIRCEAELLKMLK